MVSFAELRDAQPPMFGESADDWDKHVTNVRECAADLERRIGALGSWEGDAGAAARASLTKRHRDLADAVEWMGKIAPVLRAQQQEVSTAQRDLRAALADAEGFDLLVRGDGSVWAGYRGPGSAGEDWELKEHRAQQVSVAIAQAVRNATIADEDNGAALRSLMPAETGLAAPPATLTASSTVCVPPTRARRRITPSSGTVTARPWLVTPPAIRD